MQTFPWLLSSAKHEWRKEAWTSFLDQDVQFVNACSCFSMKMFKRSDPTNTPTDYKADLFLKERTFCLR